VKSHQGDVRVRSALGVGTTFEIYLPALAGPAGVRREFDDTPLYEAAGNECVLIVDDEQDVLSYIKETLDAHGYKTFATDSPVYAQELFHEMAGDIDLVITDMVMPLLNGAELAKQFKAERKGVKVIGISGFSGGAAAGRITDLDALIKKPFDGAKLLTSVRSVLDA
jgi:two-component system, cell cycle sensor histidine kinase and response regulator CckA